MLGHSAQSGGTVIVCLVVEAHLSKKRLGDFRDIFYYSVPTLRLRSTCTRSAQRERLRLFHLLFDFLGLLAAFFSIKNTLADAVR